MNFLFAADFQIPSGYQQLSANLATEMVKAGHQVTMLGIGYDRRPHKYPFTLVPAEWVSRVPEYIYRYGMNNPFDQILLCMDIPSISALWTQLNTDAPGFLKAHPISGLFPVESDPVCPRWAGVLDKLDHRFVFTNFGLNEMVKSGVPKTIKLDYGPSQYWFDSPSDLDIAPYQSLTGMVEHPFLLTVAKNQHRKNLPASFEIAREVLRQNPEMGYIVVTDPRNPQGWDLIEMSKRLEFPRGSILIGERANLPSRALRYLYNKASCFLLTSLAEGIGMPLYEAQAQGCPTVATNCCAIPEAISGWGSLIDVAHREPYPWGDTYHYFCDIQDGVNKVLECLNSKPAQSRRPGYYPRPEYMTDVMLSELGA